MKSSNEEQQQAVLCFPCKNPIQLHVLAALALWLTSGTPLSL